MTHIAYSRGLPPKPQFMIIVHRTQIIPRAFTAKQCLFPSYFEYNIMQRTQSKSLLGNMITVVSAKVNPSTQKKQIMNKASENNEKSYK